MILKKNNISSVVMHILAAAVIICVAVCMGKSYAVRAATYDIIYDVAAPKLDAERSENMIILSWVAADDTDLDGFSGKLTYDKDVFTYNKDDLTLTGLSASVEPQSDIIVATEQNPKRTVFNSGEPIFTLSFHLKDGVQIEQSKDYVFSFTLNKDAYNYDLDDYSWCGDTFTLTYREEADGNVLVDSEVIPDPDPITNNTADTTAGQNSGSSSGSSQSQVTAGSGGNGSADQGTPSVSWQTKSSSGNKPSTGDQNNIFLWLGIAVGAVIIICIVVVLIVKRRKKG